MNLRSRIVLTVTAVFAIVSGGAGWLVLTRAETSLQIAFDRATKTRAEWLVSLVSIDPVVIPLPNNNERMRVTAEAYDQIRELFCSPGWPRQAQPLPLYRTVMVETTPDQLPEGRVRLMLIVSATSLQADISRLRWVFGLGWLLSLVVAFGAGYIAAGWLLKPIQAIAAQADSVSQATRLDPIILPRAHDELYQLTESLNRMLARIRDDVDTQRHFFGAAAHELRTPLAVMKTGLEVTLRSPQTDTDLTLFLAGQLDEVNQLVRLIDEFLTLGRPGESPTPLTIQSVDLADLCKRCLTKVATVAADYGVTLRFTEPEIPAQPVPTDTLKLEHVLLNLIENAVKYAVAGTTVTIDLMAVSGWEIQIQNRTVQATGPTPKLIEAYFRADPFKAGHGLGLWISHRLMTLLGGTLMLDWQEFTFTSTIIVMNEE